MSHKLIKLKSGLTLIQIGGIIPTKKDVEAMKKFGVKFDGRFIKISNWSYLWYGGILIFPSGRKEWICSNWVKILRKELAAK